MINPIKLTTIPAGFLLYASLIVIFIFAGTRLLYKLWARNRKKDITKNEATQKHRILIKKQFKKIINIIGPTARSTPWYLLLGASSAGKSSLLKNSELSFHLTNADELKLKGINGATKCEWLLSNKAVFLEISSQYALEKNNWKTFLVLVKKHRRNNPINGVIITVDLPEITNADRKKISLASIDVHETINTIYKNLGFILPIYILLTKTDRIHGFHEFFKNSDKKERIKPFGIDLLDQNRNKNNKNQLDILYYKLTLQRALSDSSRLEKTDKLVSHTFPEKFYSSTQIVNFFIKRLLTPNPYQNDILLQGIYFTGISRDKGYFTKELLSKAIPENSPPPIATSTLSKLKKHIKPITTTGCIIVIISFIILFKVFLSKNISLLNKITQTTQQLKTYDSLENLQALFNYHEKSPYSSLLLKKKLQKILLAKMRILFREPLKKLLVKQLRKYNRIWSNLENNAKQAILGQYYTTLKAYMMLCFPNHVNSQQSIRIINAYWNKALTNKFYISPDRNKIISFYLKHSSPWQADKKLILKSRRNLHATNGAQNLYGELMSVSAIQLKPFPIPNLLINKYDLPGAYCRKNWNTFTKPLIEEISKDVSNHGWIIDAPLASLSIVSTKVATKTTNVVRRKIYSMFFKRYLHAWIFALSTMRLRHFSSLNNASENISILAKSNGAIAKFWRELLYNIDLRELHSTYQHLHNISPEIPKLYFSQLLGIQKELQEILASPSPNARSIKYAKNIFLNLATNTKIYKSTTTVDLLVNQIKDKTIRKAIKHFFLLPIKESWRSVLESATSHLAKSWKEKIFIYYQQNIASKFPFEKPAEEDITLSNLKYFLRPKEGVFWKFMNITLHPFLHFNNTWKSQKWLGIGINFSEDSLKRLRKWYVLATEMFHDNNNSFSFNYKIYPLPNPKLTEVTFETGKQKYTYRNGPSEWQLFYWPNTDSTYGSYLRVVTTSGNSPQPIGTEGYWSTFRLFKRATFKKISNDLYNVSWILKNDKHTYRTEYLLHSNSGFNIFKSILIDTPPLPLSLF